MKHTYRVRVQPERYYGLLHGVPPLTSESLTRAIEGVVVHEIAQGEHGDSFVDLQIHRPSHEEALNEILVAVQQLGYSWLEASVTEWTDNALAGLFVGGGACGTAGFSSGDAGLGLMLTLFGSLVGAFVGSFIESAKVVYEVQWNGYGWRLVQVQSIPALGLQPRLA